MTKIKFIKQKRKIDKNLSKLFNIVVNYNQLNSPKKVGYCTSIYDEFFRKNPEGEFQDAINFYYKKVTKLNKNEINGKLLIENHMKQTFNLTLHLLSEIETLFTYNSDKYDEIYNYLEHINSNNLKISREDQYKSMLYKTLAIFHHPKDTSEITLGKIKKWYDNIIRLYNAEDIKKHSGEYLFDLLTIDSMIGILIQNDILKYMAIRYPNEVYGTNDKFERLEIDGFINGKRASIKSVNYKHSPYKRVAKKNIEQIIKGPIIYYKIKDDSYIIANEKEVLEFYDQRGDSEKIFKEIKEVKNKLISN